METGLHFDLSRTAYLGMDYQRGIIAGFSQAADDFIPRAASTLRAARAAGLPVIHVQVGFRPGFPEVSPRNKSFSALTTSDAGRKLFDGPASGIHEAFGPEPGDVVVTKHRVNAFAGTDLEMVLRARDIHTLVLAGVATSGVVLSTLTYAADADYRIIVIADCCADADPEVHAVLTQKIFPRRGEVVTAQQFAAALAAAAGR